MGGAGAARGAAAAVCPACSRASTAARSWMPARWRAMAGRMAAAGAPPPCSDPLARGRGQRFAASEAPCFSRARMGGASGALLVRSHGWGGRMAKQRGAAGSALQGWLSPCAGGRRRAGTPRVGAHQVGARARGQEVAWWPRSRAGWVQRRMAAAGNQLVGGRGVAGGRGGGLSRGGEGWFEWRAPTRMCSRMGQGVARSVCAGRRPRGGSGQEQQWAWWCRLGRGLPRLGLSGDAHQRRSTDSMGTGA